MDVSARARRDNRRFENSWTFPSTEGAVRQVETGTTLCLGPARSLDCNAFDYYRHDVPNVIQNSQYVSIPGFTLGFAGDFASYRTVSGVSALQMSAELPYPPVEDAV